MNIAKAKERFWAALYPIESPIARNPLIEFVLGLFSEKNEEESGESEE